MIFNENCFDTMKRMLENSVDHVLTSPPYNRKRNDKYNNYNDDLVDYYEFIKDAIRESLRISSGYVFFNIQKNYYNKKEVFKIIGDFSEELIDIIIWNKSNPMPASGFNVTNSYEFILVLSKKIKTLKSNNTYTKNIINTSVYSENPYKKIHRAVMKPEVCEYLVKNFTKEGENIYDPFFGLGTTGYICKINNRSFIGSELDPEYCKLAEDRIRELESN